MNEKAQEFNTDNEVVLLGTYGGDIVHASSAWTSTTRELSEKRKQRLESFLKELAQNGHHTPFEKSVLHFLIKSDLVSHIHVLKSRIAVSVNAESARYQEFKVDKFYLPVDWPEEEKNFLERHILRCYNEYHDCLKALVAKGYTRSRAKESARYYLPYAIQLYQDVSFNFRSFMHFQKLRNSEHAQLEIRQIAQKMLELVRQTGQFDLSLKAFNW